MKQEGTPSKSGVKKAFKYRLSPTKKQEQTLLFVLRGCRDLYNSGLEQRRAFYQMRRKSLSYASQAKDIDMRWHSCPHCGLELDRDHNAAINILFRGQEVAHKGTPLSKPSA